MKKTIKIILLFTIIIFSTTNFANSTQEESSYRMKKGDTVEYVIDSFHDKLQNSFSINMSNKTVYLRQGMHFNITVKNVNATYISLELIYNNLSTTNVSQSYFSYFNFAYQTSNSSSSLLLKNQDNYHYYVSGDIYHQDFSALEQRATNFYNKTVIGNSWNWKTGWEAGFNVERNSFQMTSKGEYNLFYDLALKVTMVGLNTNTSKPLPALQFYSIFTLALIPIVHKLSKKR